MSAPPDDGVQTLLNWVLGGTTTTLLAIVGWLGSRLHIKVDAVEKAQTAAREIAAAAAIQAAADAAKFVPRMEMQKYLDDLRSEWQRDLDSAIAQMMRMHQENTRRFDKLDQGQERMHERLNEGPHRRGERTTF